MGRIVFGFGDEKWKSMRGKWCIEKKVTGCYLSRALVETRAFRGPARPGLGLDDLRAYVSTYPCRTFVNSVLHRKDGKLYISRRALHVDYYKGLVNYSSKGI